MDSKWLRAHNKSSTPTQDPTNPQEPISISEDLGKDLEKTNDLLHYFSQSEAGLLRLGRGRGKDIRIFPGIKDHLNDPEPEDDDNMDLSEGSSKAEMSENEEGDALEDEVLSVSPL